MAKGQKNNTNNIKIIHTVPKMDEIDRAKGKKTVGNELYEVFIKIQSRLHSGKEETEA